MDNIRRFTLPHIMKVTLLTSIMSHVVMKEKKKKKQFLMTKQKPLSLVKETLVKSPGHYIYAPLKDFITELWFL